MKLMFISDIHGSEYFLKKSIDIYNKENPDKLVILGDILYHGPRNSLPEGYNPKNVIGILNNIKTNIIAVKGNCDSEVDQMVLEFSIMSELGLIYYNNKRLFITHGHNIDNSSLLHIQQGDILIHGHTHIPIADNNGKYTIINPGSISLPKGEYEQSYGILENDLFSIRTFSGQTIKEINI